MPQGRNLGRHNSNIPFPGFTSQKIMITSDQGAYPVQKKFLRPLFSKFSHLSVKQDGFSTPSAFLPHQDINYGRDDPTYKDMNARFDAYFKDLKACPRGGELTCAVGQVIELFSWLSTTKLRPASISEAIDCLPSSTAAGMPFPPGVEKAQVMDDIGRLAKKQWHRVARGERILVAPCVVGIRPPIREKGNNKPRLIWTYPGYINVLETQFSVKVFDLKPEFMSWPINRFDFGKKFKRLPFTLMRASTVINLDFSAFDSTVSTTLITKAFSVVRSLFDLTDTEQDMLDDLMNYFIHTPLMFYDDVKVKHKGIPSGSAFTQLIGTIVNMIATLYVYTCEPDVRLVPEHSIWLGDDSLLNFFDHNDVEYVREMFLRYFLELGLNVRGLEG